MDSQPDGLESRVGAFAAWRERLAIHDGYFMGLFVFGIVQDSVDSRAFTLFPGFINIRHNHGSSLSELGNPFGSEKQMSRTKRSDNIDCGGYPVDKCCTWHRCASPTVAAPSVGRKTERMKLASGTRVSEAIRFG